MAEQGVSRRTSLVQKAVGDWKKALVDLGGRNTLLHYRDLKLGTLDLTKANHDAVASLLLGKTLRVSSLFQDPEQLQQAVRRVRTIHNKGKENSEERGLDTVSIGYGLATWENKRGTWTPSAPVLLQSAMLRPLGAAQEDFEISVTGEMEVNPTLLHVLTVDFGREFDQAALMARIPDGTIDEPHELLETYQWLAEQASGVPGFHVDPRMVLANFAYAKLEMVRDLDTAQDALAGHDLIAALAGDEQARATVRSQGTGDAGIPGPDQLPLAEEFLVLDADSSQSFAINAVLGGRHLIIKGPPGTGKSQTISNLIATLAARGKTVLFVAEKRAAIEAVTKRLAQRGLGGLVLDLHGGVMSRRAFAHSVGQSLDSVKTTPPVNNGAELAAVEKRRTQLNQHTQAIHRRREPWGRSVYDMQAELLGLEDARSQIRLPGSAASLDSAAFATISDELERYTDLGGLRLASSGSPWSRSPITRAQQAQEAIDILGEILGSALPSMWRLISSTSQETGVLLPDSLAAAEALVNLWARITDVAMDFGPEIYSLDLAAERAMLAPAERGGLARLWASLTSSAYRAARGRVRAAGLPGRAVTDKVLIARVTAAQEILGRWTGIGGRGTPRAPQANGNPSDSYQRLRTQLAQLESLAGCRDLAQLPITECKLVLEALDADRVTLARLPELHRIRVLLDNLGLSGLVNELSAQKASPNFAVRSLRYAYLRSALDRLAVEDLQLSGFTPDAHERIVTEFRSGDRAHIAATPGRVRRAHAERLVRAMDADPESAALVKRQTMLKKRHMPTREFVRNAASVLLAAKPCWAMSPLVVSRLLPAAPIFDVVIFDEASQVTPADAATSILRGRQLVVAGDDKQLPPTAFFASTAPEDESPSDDDEPGSEAESPLMAGTAGFESILDALAPLLGMKMLTWHYRSRDERLISFSNQHIYDGMLTTFPGAGGDQVLRYLPAPYQQGADTNSPAPEVQAVVDLILEHARECPEKSLGVITMGMAHSNRVEEQLRQRLRNDPELAAELGDFFDEEREEQFFVKNIERVQGDERDSIILSIGYGKDASGRLPYRFGPLLSAGGERRLNVAVTRAKSRLTLVSSFSANDMDPARSSARGVQLLRQYLQYVESGGTNLGDQVRDRIPLNPFEVDVRDTLTKRGLNLTAQYGVSGYWIDFAVQDPEQPAHYVLAIECDGASYHSSPSARDRDRLRQEQLERLGWRFHRIWSTDWFRDKEACADAAIEAYERALAAGTTPAAVPVPPPDAAPAGANASATLFEAQPRRDPSLNPHCTPGLAIDGYTDTELLLLARWIMSDGMLRTSDEVVTEMMRELGFQRHGNRIVARLTEAIRTAGRAR